MSATASVALKLRIWERNEIFTLSASVVHAASDIPAEAAAGVLLGFVVGTFSVCLSAVREIPTAITITIAAAHNQTAGFYDPAHFSPFPLKMNHYSYNKYYTNDS